MFEIRTSGVASLLILGASLFIAGRLLALRTRQGAAVRLLRYTAYVVLAVGVLGACLLVGGWLGYLGWPVVMIVWLRAAMHCRATQKRNLLSALALVVGKGMPPATMAAAFANEQEGSFAAHAGDLADSLEQGMPLAVVLGRSRRALPPETALAAAIGRETGDLSAALEATTYASVFERTWLQPTISRLLYLAAMLIAFITILQFLENKIAPSWNSIVEDFELPSAEISTVSGWDETVPLPEPVLDWLAFSAPTSVLRAVGALGWITVITMIGGMLTAVLLVYCWLQWRGTLMPRLPGLRRIVNWVDMAPLLRILALAVRRGRPLTGTVVAIARWHPKRTVRRRVRRVVRNLDDGMPWIDSFRQQRLIGQTEAAVLTAAEYSGNLGWALDEMAGRFERMASYRLQAMAQTVVPLLFLPLGVIAAIVANAYFGPLAALIKYLS